MSQVMGDVEALVASIHRRAEQRGLQAVAEAEKRSAEILAHSRARAEQEAEALTRQVEKDAAVLEQRLSAQGALEQRRRFLTAREALLERVWEQAEAELRCITEAPEYLQTLEALAFEAGASLGVTRLELAADPRGHQLLTAPRLSSWSQEAGVMFDRAKQPLDTWGGLLARNGRLCYDATFASRLAWARKNLRERVFAQLMETR